MLGSSVLGEEVAEGWFEVATVEGSASIVVNLEGGEADLFAPVVVEFIISSCLGSLMDLGPPVIRQDLDKEGRLLDKEAV